MIVALLDTVDLTNVILIAGIIGVAITRVGEGRGWFKSAAGLRTENTDLLRRNHELEAAVARHEITLAANDVRILALEQTIRDLEKLDQSAVLEALRAHERGAIGRAEETHRLLGESTSQLVRIATVLESQPTGAQ